MSISQTHFLLQGLKISVEKKSRKTLSIIVKKDGQVLVRSPLRMSDSRIKKFLVDKQDWILKTVKKQEQKRNLENASQQKLKQNQEIYIFDQKYKIKYDSDLSQLNCLESIRNLVFKDEAEDNSEKILKKLKKQIDPFWQNNFYVDAIKKEFLISSKVSNFQDSDLKIKSFLEKILELYFKQNIPKYLQKLKLSTDFKLKIKDYKSKWGSCNYLSKTSRIPFLKKKAPDFVGLYFNFSLVFFDYWIVDYLISHEVSHILEPNHSKNFWALVESLCPDYKQAKKWLKDKPEFRVWRF